MNQPLAPGMAMTAGLTNEAVSKTVDKMWGKLKNWATPDGTNFVAVPKVYQKLPPGAYDVVISPQGFSFSKNEIRTDELISFPDSDIELVTKEIEDFWSKKELFKKLELPYKRGIIMDGPPGSGKTCTVRWIINEVIKREGIVLNFNVDAVTFTTAMKQFRAAEPDTPLVVIMEDLDALLQMYGNSEILNILDGFGSVENTVFIATTNYPERLQERIVNRPSRFDRRVTINNPDKRCRLIFLKNKFEKLPEETSEKIGVNEDFINKWAELTESLSFAHIQELFTSVIVLENDFDETLERLKKMKEVPDSEDYGKEKGGFFSTNTLPLGLGQATYGRPVVAPRPFL